MKYTNIEIGTHFMWGGNKYKVIADGKIYGYTEEENFEDSHYLLENILKEVNKGHMKIIEPENPIYEIY